MPRTIYLIHHTHTDVGYTELQGRIVDRQIDFIRQALRLAEADDRFRWTCETFWAVEQYLRLASEDEQRRFVEAVRSGRIGLSASYLNFSELLDYETHRDLGRRTRAFGEAHGLPIRSAMTADINGHSLAYAQALAEQGVDQLFTCVHTHHGMYPLFRNQTPFFWRMPGGERILVWSGEHYHLGNELGLVPGAFMTRMVDDVARPGEDPMSVAERRVPAYLDYLDAQGYSYGFVPLMVSGLMTDNAPPSPALTDHIDAWNGRHGDDARLVLGTLETFFEALRAENAEIPTYEGLWPDWWADFLVAAPAATQVFREAQRVLSLYRRLAAKAPDGSVAAPSPVGPDEVVDHLALFAEHTFGHSATHTHPDHLLVAACAMRKNGYAVEALEGATRLVDARAMHLGAAGFEAGRPLRFNVVNPRAEPFVGPVRLELDQFESGDVEVSFEAAPALPDPIPGFSAMDAETGETLPSQAMRAPRGVQIVAWLELAPGETRTVSITRSEPADRPFIWPTQTRGVDGSEDVAREGSGAKTADALETPFVRIAWSAGDGIRSWVDKRSGRELLNAQRVHDAFTPVHEISPGSPRTPMGRNRKGATVVRTPGRLVGVRGSWSGSLFSNVQLEYELPGTRRCDVLLRAYHVRPLVEVEISLHKDTSVDVESLYLALPFSASPKAELWIDTSTRPMRPWKDQLPGTLTDFFHVFDGIASVGPGFGLGIATPDTPLLQLGDLASKPRLLAGKEALTREPMRPYAWLMNNFWETNANIDLAGFYRFRYSVFWGEDLGTAEQVFLNARNLNSGVFPFRRR